MDPKETTNYPTPSSFPSSQKHMNPSQMFPNQNNEFYPSSEYQSMNEKLSESMLNEKKSQRNTQQPQPFLKQNFPQTQQNNMLNMNPGFPSGGPNNYEAMMNMFKMFGPQMMDYMNNFTPMGMNAMAQNPMNMGFNPMNPMMQMNPANPMHPMNMMKSINQMNTMHINNVNNPTLISSSANNSQVLREKNEAMPSFNNNNPMFPMVNPSYSAYEDNKMEEILRNKARNLNDFYNSVNFMKKNDENLETSSSKQQKMVPPRVTSISKKYDNFMEESEVKLPNKSEFLNYQEFNENQGEPDDLNNNLNNMQRSFQDSNYQEDKYSFTENQKCSQNRNNNPNLERSQPNFTCNNNNTFKETDEINQKLFQNEEKEDLNQNQRFEKYEEELENYENPIQERSQRIPSKYSQNNEVESKARSTQEFIENEMILQNRKGSEQFGNDNNRRASDNRKAPMNYDEIPIGGRRNEPEMSITSQKPFNSFDEIPIQSRGNKNFEELLEEELKANQLNNDYVPNDSPKPKPKQGKHKKEFLKRHSRQYLSNAVTKPEKKNKTPIVRQETIKNEEENEVNEDPEEMDQASAQKKSKKFLTKGRGIGGGKGPISVGGKEEKEKPKEKEKKRNDESDQEPHEFSNKKKYEPNKYVSTSRHSSQESPQSSKKIEFNDEQEWLSNQKNPVPNEKANKKQPEAKKLNFEKEDDFEELEEKQENKEPVEIFDEDNSNQEAQSNILQKYFNKAKKTTKNKQPFVEISKEQEEDIIRKYVDEKIEALNQEIAKFKSENEAVKRLKKKYDEMNKTLAKQMEDFTKKKEADKNEFELLKQEELKKIQKEKKNMERQTKTIVENKPSRKEREEIDTLKKQMAKLMEENKLKEQRNKLAFERLRKQNEELTQKNQELQDEIKHLETLRVSEKMNSNNNKNVATAKEKATTRVENNKKKEAVLGPAATIKGTKESEYKEESDAENEMEQHNSEAQSNSDKLSQKEEEQEDYNTYEAYEDIINKNPNNKKKAPLQENKAINKKATEKQNFSKEKPLKKPEEEKILKENLKNSVKNVQNPKKDDDEEEEEEYNENSYANITIRNLNKYFNEKDFDFDNNEFYLNYMKHKSMIQKIKTNNVAPDGKIHRVYEDGKSELIFPNGVKREVFPDGYTIVHFTNNDVKQCLPNKVIIYYFAEAQTTQTTLPNGPNVYKFSNNQIEMHHLDGSKEIKFADGTEKYIYSNGEEETLFCDGTIQKIDDNKTKTIFYTNGQKDIVLPDGTKIKEYPDGKIKRFQNNKNSNRK